MFVDVNGAAVTSEREEEPETNLGGYAPHHHARTYTGLSFHQPIPCPVLLSPWTYTPLSFHQLPLAFGSLFSLNSLPGSFLVNLSCRYPRTSLYLDEHWKHAQACLPCSSWGQLSHPQRPYSQPPPARVTYGDYLRDTNWGKQMMSRRLRRFY